MDTTGLPYKNRSDLEHLTLVADHYANPVVKADVRKINELMLKDGIQNCVALAVYGCLKFSGIAPSATGDEVVTAFRGNGEKMRSGFSDLDIHLLIEALTKGEYTASLFEHTDYLSNRLEIERRASPAMIAEVTPHGTQEAHVYATLKIPDNRYHIIDNFFRERVLGDAIGNYIGSNKTKRVICVHKNDVKFDDLRKTLDYF